MFLLTTFNGRAQLTTTSGTDSSITIETNHPRYLFWRSIGPYWNISNNGSGKRFSCNG